MAGISEISLDFKFFFFCRNVISLSHISLDMLLEALVACSGVTLTAVATSLAIPITSGHVSAFGDLDFKVFSHIDYHQTRRGKKTAQKNNFLSFSHCPAGSMGNSRCDFWVIFCCSAHIVYFFFIGKYLHPAYCVRKSQFMGIAQHVWREKPANGTGCLRVKTRKRVHGFLTRFYA